MAKQNTWTLVAMGRSSWEIPYVLEKVTGVKTSDMYKVTQELYAKYANNDCYHDCHEVRPIKEERKSHAY